MEKFEAGRKFLEILKLHPTEFVVEHINERSYEAYRIEHKITAVAVTVCISEGHAKYDGMNRAGNLNYVDQATTDALMSYAIHRIAEDKQNEMINNDNQLISNLVQYYNE